jgi:serine/threonine protein kinase
METFEECIRCEYTNIKSTIELLPIFDTRLNILECLKFNNKRAIYKVYDKKLKIYATAKFIIKRNIQSKRLCIINFIKNSSHENLSSIYEIGSIGSFYVILTQYISGVTLDCFIKQCENVKTLQFVITGILKGLKFLHNNNIQHSDIKPSNIVINDTNVAKIIDFDMVTEIKDKYIVQHVIMGTLPYIPKEVIMEKKYYLKSDIWELGVAIVKPLIEWKSNLKSSIGSIEEEFIFDNSVKKKLIFYTEYEDIDLTFAHNKIGKAMCEIVNEMLTVDVEDRPTSSNLIKKIEKIEKIEKSLTRYSFST